MSENKIEETVPEQNSVISQEEFDALKIQLAEQNKKIEALLKAGEAVPVADVIPELPTKTFKVGEREFKFTIPQFIIPGIGKRTATEALADKATLETIVAKNLGVVKEVF